MKDTITMFEVDSYKILRRMGGEYIVELGQGLAIRSATMLGALYIVRSNLVTEAAKVEEAIRSQLLLKQQVQAEMQEAQK